MTIEKTIGVKVPGSTSNLGPGFDCFGLALRIYLNVTVSRLRNDANEAFRITAAGSESNGISTGKDNLILSIARETAASLGRSLPAIELNIENEIPLGRGLGSSAAAIVAGVAIGARCCGVELTPEELVARASIFEGHADNAAASVLGGRVICYQNSTGAFRALKLPWPAVVQVIVVSPDVPLATKEARAVLPKMVSREDAVFNLQRTALLTAALDHGHPEVIREAMRDRLHQPARAGMVPGLATALNLPVQPGLLGLALSGAGPSVVALASNNVDDIGRNIAQAFEEADIKSSIRILDVDNNGLHVID